MTVDFNRLTIGTSPHVGGSQESVGATAAGQDRGKDDLGVNSTVSIGRRSCGAGGCRDRRTTGLLLREVGRASLLHLCTLSTLLDSTYRAIEL